MNLWKLVGKPVTILKRNRRDLSARETDETWINSIGVVGISWSEDGNVMNDNITVKKEVVRTNYQVHIQVDEMLTK